MSKQPEQIQEEQLVGQLQNLNYGLVPIKDEKELIANSGSSISSNLSEPTCGNQSLKGSALGEGID